MPLLAPGIPEGLARCPQPLPAHPPGRQGEHSQLLLPPDGPEKGGSSARALWPQQQL